MAWPNVYGLDTQQFERERSPTQKPTLVLAHDAFHTPGHYNDLIEALSQTGLRVLAPQMPSSGQAIVPNALEADARTLFDSCKDEIDASRNIVMLSHGYGSVPGVIAAERLNQYCLDRPRAGHVAKLIIVAGVLLSAGESFMTAVRPGWISSTEVLYHTSFYSFGIRWTNVLQNGLARVQQPEYVFYQDCTPSDRSRACSLLQSQSENSLHATVASSGWCRIPTLYVVCAQDNCMLPSLQQTFARTLQVSNRRSAVVTLQTGHSPFLTNLRELVHLILRVVE